MGIDLLAHGGFSLNWHGWRSALELAQRYGWEPAGTVREKDEFGNGCEGVWSGTYYSNDFQKVTDEDAKQLSDALERAIQAGEPAEEEVEDPDQTRFFYEYERAFEAKKESIATAEKRLQNAGSIRDTPTAIDAAEKQLADAWSIDVHESMSANQNTIAISAIVRDNRERWRQRIMELIDYCRRGGFLIG